ncbi:MAG: hypothetical protein ACI4B9_07670 [Eggerthellaceae bacterium]
MNDDYVAEELEALAIEVESGLLKLRDALFIAYQQGTEDASVDAVLEETDDDP